MNVINHCKIYNFLFLYKSFYAITSTMLSDNIENKIVIHNK